MTYDIIYAPAEKDNPEKFCDWATWEQNLEFNEALSELSLIMEEDHAVGSNGYFAYRIVQHREGGV